MSHFTPFLWLLILTPLFVIAGLTSKKTNVKYLLIFVIYFILDYFLLEMGHKFLNPEFLKFNWLGKILSVALSLAFIFFHSKEIRKDIGFTTESKKNTLKLGIAIFLGILLFDFVFKMILFPKGGKFNLETFLYQATMPGITEELVFRGIYLWLLSKSFVGTKVIKGVAFGWGFIIVTFLFALVHGVYWTETFEIKVDFFTIIYLTLVTSLSLGILRKFSGNLIFPILGHNIVNIMNATIRIL